jgi:hypothetical protein
MTSPNVNTLTGSSSSPLILTNSTSTIAPPATTSPTGNISTNSTSTIAPPATTSPTGNISTNCII